MHEMLSLLINKEFLLGTHYNMNCIFLNWVTRDIKKMYVKMGNGKLKEAVELLPMKHFSKLSLVVIGYWTENN